MLAAAIATGQLRDLYRSRKKGSRHERATARL